MGAMGDGDLILRAGGRTLALGGRPLLMGILNATPDSFSGDGARLATVDDLIARARELADEGAEVIDVGGGPQTPPTAPVDLRQDDGRVVPRLVAVAADLSVLASVAPLQ